MQCFVQKYLVHAADYKFYLRPANTQHKTKVGELGETSSFKCYNGCYAHAKHILYYVLISITNYTVNRMF